MLVEEVEHRSLGMDGAPIVDKDVRLPPPGVIGVKPVDQLPEKVDVGDVVVTSTGEVEPAVAVGADCAGQREVLELFERGPLPLILVLRTPLLGREDVAVEAVKLRNSLTMCAA